MSENSPLDDIAYLIAEFEEQKKIIYSHYSQAVASVMTGRITAENEIEKIMDGLLDFGDDEQFLVLYKKLCRHVYNSYPQMVSEHITLFRMQFEEIDNDHENERQYLGNHACEELKGRNGV